MVNQNHARYVQMTVLVIVAFFLHSLDMAKQFLDMCVKKKKKGKQAFIQE